jgi:ABC-2 type transport system permease protein
MRGPLYIGMLLRAEALQLLRSPVHAVLLAAVASVLAWSAWTAGGAAAQRQAQLQREQLAWQARWDEAAQGLARASQDPRKAALAAFNMARHAAPPTPLDAQGMAFLAAGQYQSLPTGLRASIDGRHTESRRGDAIASPVAQGQGTPDFAVLVALLLPLAAIALGYGRVQEARASGLWSLVRAQSGTAWRPFTASLALQWAILLVVVAAASLCGVAASGQWPGTALGAWLLACTAYAGFWVAVTGLANLPRFSAAASASLLLGAWALVCLAVPAALDRLAQQSHPLPSRAATVLAVRDVQQAAEQRSDELLASWYAGHPQHRRDELQPHAWPVSWVPRYLWQDAQLRGLMLRFDETRARQYAEQARLSGFSPASALVIAAEQLAGVDAPRYARYVHGINAYEDAWRSYFVPRIMRYAPMQAADVHDGPRPRIAVAPTTASVALTGLGLLCALAWCLLALLRGRLD